MELDDLYGVSDEEKEAGLSSTVPKSHPPLHYTNCLYGDLDRSKARRLLDTGNFKF